MMYFPVSRFCMSSLIRSSYISVRLMSSSLSQQNLIYRSSYTIKNGTGFMHSLLLPKQLILLPQAGLSKIKFERSRTVAKLYAKDGIPQKYELIYRSDIDQYFLFVQAIMAFIFLTTVAIAIKLSVETDSIKKLKERMEQGLPEPTSNLKDSLKSILDEEETALPPRMQEIGEGDDIYLVYLAVATTISMILAALKFQRMIPVRVYMSPSGHCVAAHMSSWIPTRTRQRQFVAGTLKKYYKNPSVPIAECIYKDATGHTLFLFDASFRSSQDMHNLLEPDDSTSS